MNMKKTSSHKGKKSYIMCCNLFVNTQAVYMHPCKYPGDVIKKMLCSAWECKVWSFWYRTLNFTSPAGPWSSWLKLTEWIWHTICKVIHLHSGHLAKFRVPWQNTDHTWFSLSPLKNFCMFSWEFRCVFNKSSVTVTVTVTVVSSFYWNDKQRLCVTVMLHDASLSLLDVEKCVEYRWDLSLSAALKSGSNALCWKSVFLCKIWLSVMRFDADPSSHDTDYTVTA